VQDRDQAQCQVAQPVDDSSQGGLVDDGPSINVVPVDPDASEVDVSAT
jgi:hypothetical protein